MRLGDERVRRDRYARGERYVEHSRCAPADGCRKRGERRRYDCAERDYEHYRYAGGAPQRFGNGVNCDGERCGDARDERFGPREMTAEERRALFARVQMRMQSRALRESQRDTEQRAEKERGCKTVGLNESR